MNFFPSAAIAANGYARTDVYANTRCVKEEKITLHIPQERLDAARFDGLTIIVLDNAGNEVPVYLPPNYIEGFRKAVSGYGGTVNYSSGQSYSGGQTIRASLIRGSPIRAKPRRRPRPMARGVLIR